MGNQPSDPCNSQTYIRSQQYGGKVILRRKTKTIYQQTTVEENHMQRFLRFVQKRRKLVHPNFVTLTNYFFNKNPPARLMQCNDSKCTVFVEYPYIERHLQGYIEEFIKNRSCIPEMEIRSAFYSVVNCLQYLRKNGTCHGDIKNSNIMLDQNGKIKLIDSYFVNGGKTAYEILLQNPQSLSLLSPQQLSLLINRQFQNLQDMQTNEIFSVGLAMLEAMTLSPAIEAYDLSNLKIRTSFYTERYSELQNGPYSSTLRELVFSCFANKNDRPSFQQFMKVIKM